MTIDSLAQLSDRQLLSHVQTLCGDERRATAALVASLAELDARRLYLGEGCSSLFTYCTQVLHLSEHAAYGRIEAARVARRFTILLDLLADGSLTLTAICLLAPHLTMENQHEVLAAARHKSKREVEVLVATLRPHPPVPARVRKLPAPSSAQVLDRSAEATPLLASVSDAKMTACHTNARAASPSKSGAAIAPLSPELYKLQVTLSAATHDKLCRAQDLMRYSLPDGDLAAVLDRALTLLIGELEKTKFAATDRPRVVAAPAGHSRYIPAGVRRRVWKRDGGQCAFVGTNGRCTERSFLEFHHLVPYAESGQSVVENVALRCRAHNAYEAEEWFGPLFAREKQAFYELHDPARSRPSCGIEPSTLPAVRFERLSGRDAGRH